MRVLMLLLLLIGSAEAQSHSVALPAAMLGEWCDVNSDPGFRVTHYYTRGKCSDGRPTILFRPHGLESSEEVKCVFDEIRRLARRGIYLVSTCRSARKLLRITGGLPPKTQGASSWTNVSVLRIVNKQLAITCKSCT